MPVINKLENVIMNQQQLIVAMSSYMINGGLKTAQDCKEKNTQCQNLVPAPPVEN